MPKEIKNIEAAWSDFNQNVQREVYSVRWPDGIPREIESAIRQAKGLRGNIEHVRAALEEFNTVTFNQLKGCRFDNQIDPNCGPMWHASIALRFGRMNGAASQIRYLRGVVEGEIQPTAKAAGMNLDETYLIPAMPAQKGSRQTGVQSEFRTLKH